MARYRVALIINTEEDVSPDLIEEYVIDVLASMPFDAAERAPSIEGVNKDCGEPMTTVIAAR